MFQRTKICSGLLLAFGSSLLAVAPGAFAQDTNVQRVEITGSSIKRVDAETAVPVTVIKADDLKKMGVTTVEEILQNISAAQVQQTSAQAVGASTGGASFADLRGLGANKTLVLLNGRRIANQALDSSAPDLNMIPFAAIERVEVLRDGASSLYGTDAISGVINFITRKDFRGGSISVGLDAPQHPGGSQHSANMSFGFGDLDKDGLNVFGVVDFQKQGAVMSSQRPGNQAKYQSTGFFGPSSSTFPATWFGTVDQYPNPTGTQTYVATPFDAGNCTGANHLYQKGKTSSPLTANQCGEVTTDFIGLVPASERISGYGKASFKVNADNTFNVEAFVAHSKVAAITAPVPYGGINIATTNPYFPGHGITPLPPGITISADQSQVSGAPNGDLTLFWRDTFNGYREDTNVGDQARIVASMEGTIKDWDYEIGLAHNQNTTKDILTHGYTNINILAPFSAVDQNYVLSDAVNPFGAQTAAGAAVLNAANVTGVLQSGTGQVETIDGHVSHDLPDWLNTGHPGAIAFGFEGRREIFSSSVNFPVGDAVQVSTGLDPTSHNGGTRNVYAGYFEWNLPLLKTLDVTLAARYDHYSDFGSTTNPKVSFRFEPSKRFLVRGSYSTGFRAPSLYELHASQAYGNSDGGDNDPRYTDPNTGVCSTTAPSYANACNQQFEQLTGGNLKLKPERSHSINLGTVIEPIDNVTAEFDYWNIRYNNQIGALPDNTLFDPKLYSNFGQYYNYNASSQLSISSLDCAPGGIAAGRCGYVNDLNQNLGGVRTDGVDMALGYKMNAGSIGRFNFNLNSTWVHSYKYQNFQGGPYIQNTGIYSGSGPIFRWTHNGTINWNLDPFSVGLAIHYKTGYNEAKGTFGGAGPNGPITNPAYKVSAYTTMDLFGTYAMSKGFAFTLGVRNLADSKPPYSYQTSLFQTGYDPRFSDIIGRTYYGRATYSF